jgi:hypothetical protein
MMLTIGNMDIDIRVTGHESEYAGQVLLAAVLASSVFSVEFIGLTMLLEAIVFNHEEWLC